MPEDYQAILVTGSHRSGTTWVGKTLYQHKGTKYVHEPFNVDYEKGSMYLDLDTWFAHAPVVDDYEKIKKRFNHLFYSNPVRRSVELCRISEKDAKLPLRFVKFLFFKSTRPKIIIKDPIALLSAGWIYEHYPVKVICMIRNPLGFVGSLKKAGWDFDFTHFLKQEELLKGRLLPFKDDIINISDVGDFIDRACLLWNILHHTIYEYKQLYPEWLFIKYRDIALNPLEKFSEIFEYAGLEMDPDIEKYIRDYTSPKNPKEAETFEYQPRASHKVLENWKSRLTESEIERVKSTTEDIYKKLF